MKRKVYIYILAQIIFCLWIPTVQAITIYGTPPRITFTNVYGETNPAYLEDISNEINEQLNASFEDALTEANGELARYNKQTKLAKGFANASVYASRSATHQGYQDYSLFAITTGAMLGIQGPSFNPDYYTDEMADRVEDEGDAYAGIGVGTSLLNVGLNASFITPGLFLNFKFGLFTLGTFADIEEVSASNALFGLGASYTWIKTTSLLFGLFKWRGLSISSGLYYNRTNVDVIIELDEIEEEMSGFPVPGPDNNTIEGSVILDPSFKLGLQVDTVTIPIEINTSVRFLWALNFNLGLGVDFAFGSSNIILIADGDVTTDIGDGQEVSAKVTPGNLTIDGSTKGGSPSFMNPRITTGIGINILPVKIDIPIAVYLDSGASIGLTVGVVW